MHHAAARSANPPEPTAELWDVVRRSEGEEAEGEEANRDKNTKLRHTGHPCSGCPGGTGGPNALPNTNDLLSRFFNLPLFLLIYVPLLPLPQLMPVCSCTRDEGRTREGEGAAGVRA
jgi:hypothetical protein